MVGTYRQLLCDKISRKSVSEKGKREGRFEENIDKIGIWKSSGNMTKILKLSYRRLSATVCKIQIVLGFCNF